LNGKPTKQNDIYFKKNHIPALGGNMKWTVKNFKSIEKATLDLTPGKFTLLAGTNSSGKSSIIQSLLVAAQSKEKSLKLNGHLVRLGKANEVIRESSKKHSNKLELEIQEISILKDSITYIFDESKNKKSKVYSPYTLHLKEMHVKDSEGKEYLTLKQLGKNQSKISKERAQDKSLIAGTYNISQDSILDVRKTKIKKNSNIRSWYTIQSGAKISTLIIFPTDEYMSNLYDDMLSKNSVEKILKISKKKTPSISQEDTDTLFEDHFMSFYKKIFRTQRIEDFLNDKGLLSDSIRISKASRRIYARRTPEYREIHSILEKLYEDQTLWEGFIKIVLDNKIKFYSLSIASYRSLIIGRTYNTEKYIEYCESVRGLMRDFRNFNREFINIGERVNYLGPLRQNPADAINNSSILYDLYDGRNAPVGIMGEITSRKLLEEGKEEVSRYTRIPSGEPVKDQQSLAELVNIWSTYIGLGDRINTYDEGRLGIKTRIKVSGGERDLSSVGVGVSQALPVITALLSISPRSIFLVEQPELHLHPLAQARMLNFLTTARPDVCVIIETHSEAMLNRLRRMVAEDKLNIENINILYVERSNPDNTSVRKIDVNEYADLKEWPKDFLTASTKDIDSIVQNKLLKMNKYYYNQESEER
jgi:hypothetical protein